MPLLNVDNTEVGATHREGELYKVITTHGKSFEIYYGYYEESDRYSKYPEPIEVFPDFLTVPMFTDEGVPFATAIQKPCEHFKKVRDVNDCCLDCAYYESGCELIGICRHRERQRRE